MAIRPIYIRSLLTVILSIQYAARMRYRFPMLKAFYQWLVKREHRIVWQSYRTEVKNYSRSPVIKKPDWFKFAITCILAAMRSEAKAISERYGGLLNDYISTFGRHILSSLQESVRGSEAHISSRYLTLHGTSQA
ncbi:hypothetical protein BDV41DRAFT_211110 [Aspergillus transmontanensis]|uniref:Uncharacterized protein n=1 Tax=Aspergillus transmontanensis TaxID=1034304 RepID=A0A5N6W210_9EURO|nr:hypothetical protein BDV41DRAFT_211110 [Aspergillus transmontanensis]